MCVPQQVNKHHWQKSSSTHWKIQYAPFFFNQLKKSMQLSDTTFILFNSCLRWFLWRYFNDKCPECIIVNARAIKCSRTNLFSLRWILFTLTQNVHAFSHLHVHIQKHKLTRMDNGCKSVFTKHNRSKCVCLVSHIVLQKSHLLSRNRSIASWSP